VKKPTGVCPLCNKSVALRADGTLNKHGFAQNRGGHLIKSRKPCEGSGKQATAKSRKRIDTFSVYA